MIGFYLGTILDQKYLETVNYPFFNDTDFVTSIKRTAVCFVVGIPFLLPMILVSKKNPVWVVLIFRNLVPSTLGSLYLFGLSKSVAVYFGLANTTKTYKYKDEIYE